MILHRLGHGDGAAPRAQRSRTVALRCETAERVETVGIADLRPGDGNCTEWSVRAAWAPANCARRSWVAASFRPLDARAWSCGIVRVVTVKAAITERLLAVLAPGRKTLGKPTAVREWDTKIQ